MGAAQPEVTSRMMEAWNWLERQGLVIRNHQQPAGWFFISGEGELTNLEHWRRASRLPGIVPINSLVKLRENGEHSESVGLVALPPARIGH
jgi:hypothetical protein